MSPARLRRASRIPSIISIAMLAFVGGCSAPEERVGGAPSVLSERDRLEAELDAQVAEVEAEAHTAELTAQATNLQRQELIATRVVERQSAIDTMRSESQSEWNRALAEHYEQLAHMGAVAERGEAMIMRMQIAADSTRAASIAKADQLDREAQVIREQAAAEAVRLRAQINATDQQSIADLSKLERTAELAQEERQANILELRARADALETHEGDAEYELALTSAEAEYAQAKSASQRLRHDADKIHRQAEVESDRRLAKAQERLDLDGAAYKASLSQIRTALDKSVAAATLERTRAAQAIMRARRAYVDASVETRLNNARLLAFDLVSDQLVSTASADAAGSADEIIAQTSTRLDELIQTGRFDPDEVDLAAGPIPQELLSDIADMPERRAFRRALVVHLARQKVAQRDRREALAKAELDTGAQHAWWRERQGEHEIALARVETMLEEAAGRATQLVEDAEQMLAQADARLARAESEAGAARRAAHAEALALRAEGDALEQENESRSLALASRINAVQEGAGAQMRVLDVMLSSSVERSEALASQLEAEAEAVRTRDEIDFARSKEEIGASQRSLATELDRLQVQADSLMSAAEADLEERLAMADALERIMEADANEALAQSEAAHQAALAGVAHRERVADAARWLAQAQVAQHDVESQTAATVSEALERLEMARQIDANDTGLVAQLLHGGAPAIDDASGARSRFDQIMSAAALSRLHSGEVLERLRSQTDDFLHRLETQWPEMRPLDRSSKVVSVPVNQD